MISNYRRFRVLHESKDCTNPQQDLDTGFDLSEAFAELDAINEEIDEKTQQEAFGFEEARLPFPKSSKTVFSVDATDVDQFINFTKSISDDDILRFVNGVRGLGIGLNNGGMKAIYKTARAEEIRNNIIFAIRNALQDAASIASQTGKVPQGFSASASGIIRGACGVDPKTYNYDPEALWKREIDRGEPTEIVNAY